jgi:signal transduction histidine kinase
MKLVPVLLIIGIVLLPLSLLTWAAIRLAKQENDLSKQRLQGLIGQRVDDLNGLLKRHFEELAGDIRRVTAIDQLNPEELRELARNNPRLAQLFVVDLQGLLIYPNPQEPLGVNESNFLVKTSRMFANRELFAKEAGLKANQETKPKIDPSLVSSISQPLNQTDDSVDGWQIWFWDQGQQLIYWQRRPSGIVVGAVLERARWIADLIDQLPDSYESSLLGLDPVDSTSLSKVKISPTFRLINFENENVYQWSQAKSSTDEPLEPIAEVAVVPPLGSWRILALLPSDQLRDASSKATSLGLLLGIVGTGLFLATLATLLLRGYQRDLKEAAKQVSFVNQVSHELKTPLTNIRLYTELLERDLESFQELPTSSLAAGSPPSKKLNVILSEIDRLSRLINNVLSFAKHQRKVLQPELQTVSVHLIVQKIVEAFRPSLEALKVSIEVDNPESPPRLLDPDFVEQILGNLINNIEKYASDGGSMGIRVSSDTDFVEIQVSDRGPGIEVRHRERIFQPFERLSHRLQHAAGTGIGLTIARQLARLHGGELSLVETPEQTAGCTFLLRIKAPKP